MSAFDIIKIISREARIGLGDAAIALTKGKVAMAERRVVRLLEQFAHDIVPAQELVGHAKFQQLQKDVAEMAAKIGRKPPEIKVLRSSIMLMGAPSDRILLVSMEELEGATSAQLKGMLGHELGHVVRGDYLSLNRPTNHIAEFEADRIGAELSGEHGAMATWLRARAETNPMAEIGTHVYPKHSERIRRILEQGKRSGGSFVRAENPGEISR
jgi:Zn-dependent protease with chaperone function